MRQLFHQLVKLDTKVVVKKPQSYSRQSSSYGMVMLNNCICVERFLGRQGKNMVAVGSCDQCNNKRKDQMGTSSMYYQMRLLAGR